MSEAGIVIGEARPERITFTSKNPVRVGDYVTVDTDDGRVLYMVEYFKNVSALLSESKDYQTADEARRASLKNPRDRVRIGVVIHSGDILDTPRPYGTAVAILIEGVRRLSETAYPSSSRSASTTYRTSQE